MSEGDFDLTSTLMHYLKGTEFPAEKEEVASNAESHGAPQDLVNLDQERRHRPLREPRGG